MRKPENIKRFKRMLNDFLNLKQETGIIICYS